MNSINQEIYYKLELMRKALSETGAMGVRLRGSDSIQSGQASKLKDAIAPYH